jgi:hypothetical protein
MCASSSQTPHHLCIVIALFLQVTPSQNAAFQQADGVLLWRTSSIGRCREAVCVFVYVCLCVYVCT